MGRPKAGGKGSRGGGKDKDPNRPKRPTSAYFFFARFKREELARAGKSITRVADFTKEISQEWRNLTATAKKPFDDKAKIDKERYTYEMGNYKGRKQTKDPMKPKRPCSAYFMFLAEFRTENKDKYSEHKDLIKAAGAAWQDMNEQEKKPYDKMAENEKRKYNEAMTIYNQGGSKSSNGAAVAAVPIPDDDDDDEYDDDEEDDE